MIFFPRIGMDSEKIVLLRMLFSNCMTKKMKKMKISNALDAKKATLGLFIDLSKAFDTVNREILLNKLEHYGVRSIVLQWFKSYLCCRKQFFNCAI